MKHYSFSKYIACASILLAGILTGCQGVQEPEKDTVNSKVMMRSCNVNGNQWAILPEYPTQEEITKVMTMIGNGSATVAEFPAGCTEYIIQDVAGAHKEYTYTDRNGAGHNVGDGTARLEHIEIQELSGNWVHVNNFNRGKCDNAATHNAALMDNGFLAAKALNEYSGSFVTDWRIFLIDGNYYLGFDFSMKKDDGEIPGDGIFDDWVVKIIPLNGEQPDPDPEPDPKPEPDPENPDPEEPEFYGKAHVEFDVHQQEHKDWKEIKTSIHLRDTVDFTILLPIPEKYQAESDDFDLRLGEKYEYLAHEITIVDKTYEIIFEVTHKAEGIEIFVKGSECAQALRAARALYGDGLTFEVHTYVKNEVEGVAVTDEQVWNWLKTTEKPITSPETTLIGQITSAFYPEDGIHFSPEK